MGSTCCGTFEAPCPVQRANVALRPRQVRVAGLGEDWVSSQRILDPITLGKALCAARKDDVESLNVEARLLALLAEQSDALRLGCGSGLAGSGGGRLLEHGMELGVVGGPRAPPRVR